MPVPSREGAREAEALELLARTDVSPGARRLLLAGFIGLLSFVVVAQPFVRRAPRLPASAPAPDAAQASAAPKKARKRLLQRLLTPPEAETLRRFERSIEEKTAVGRWLRPAVQRFMLHHLHQGSANVVAGHDDWLFYRKDVDHLVGHAFLAADRLKQRRRGDGEDGPIEPDPVPAITAFSMRLAKRGVQLVVLPVPVKPSIYADELSPGAPPGSENASYQDFLARLRAADVSVVDLAPAFARAKSAGQQLYARRDTHWTAPGIAIAADSLAPLLKPGLADAPPEPFSATIVKLPLPGDLDGLLKLPAPPEMMPCHQVLDAAGQPFRPKTGAPLVLLGDSFSMACALPRIGGGLGAVLASELHVDVDIVASAGGGSRESRVAFEAQPERFANAKVVVWEFVTRALTFGNWR